MLDAATSGYGGIRPDTGWECGACKGCSAARCSWRRSRRWPGRGSSCWCACSGSAGRAAARRAPVPEAGAHLPEAGEPHAALAPVLFLLGRWEGAGVGGYPTIESFQFGQEISYNPNVQPYLIYVSRPWLLDADGGPGRPLAMETGFWRPQPEGKIEVVLAHPTGIAEIYLGEVTGTKIELATDVVATTASAKEVRGGRRLYGLVGSDLAYAYDMAAGGQSVQPHTSAQLKRVGSGCPIGMRHKRDPGRLPRSVPARRARLPGALRRRGGNVPRVSRSVTGTGWTRPVSPGARCLPCIRRPPP